MRSSELFAEHLKPIKCLSYGHSYEILDYVPDFNHECYRLQIQCIECGLEASDKVDKNMKDSGQYEYPTLNTSMRYCRQSDEVFNPIKQTRITKSNYAIGGIQL